MIKAHCQNEASSNSLWLNYESVTKGLYIKKKKKSLKPIFCYIKHTHTNKLDDSNRQDLSKLQTQIIYAPSKNIIKKSNNKEMRWSDWSWAPLVGHRVLPGSEAGHWEASVVSVSLAPRGGGSTQGQQIPPFYSIPTESQQSKKMMNVGARGILETL